MKDKKVCMGVWIVFLLRIRATMFALAYQHLFLACLSDTNAPNALGNSDHPLLDIEWPIKIGIWAQAAQHS